MRKRNTESVFARCHCGGDMIEFTMDLSRPKWPIVYINLWEIGHRDDSRPSLWQRLRSAWYEFKGELTHDSIIIEDIADLRIVHNKLGEFLWLWPSEEELKELKRKKSNDE